MKRCLVLTILVAALVAPTVTAECPDIRVVPDRPLNPGEPALIKAEGAFLGTYSVEAYDRRLEAWVDLGPLYGAGAPFPRARFASDQTIQVRIVPERAEDCFQTLEVEVKGDPNLREELGQAIIPVVGSIEGAFGSQWKTSLSLTNNTNTTLRGTIVFHPAGQVASDSDPSMDYVLGAGDVRQWEDIVAAMGATGLGTLDIIPRGVEDSMSVEDLALPEIQTRVVNVTADGTFGTDVPEIFASDILPVQLEERTIDPTYPSSPTGRGIAMAIVIPEDSEHSRINIGARFLGFSSLYYPVPPDPRGSPFVSLSVRRDGEYIETGVYLVEEPGYFNQYNLQDLLTTQLMPGDVVIVRAVSALPYWTLTDNRTNDPNFVIDYYTDHGDTLRVY